MSEQTTPVMETIKLTPAQEKIRKRRGLLLALALFSFVILVFVITLVRLGENASVVANSRDFSTAVEYFSDDGTKITADGKVVEETPDLIVESEDDEAGQ
ncbi:hypothetical protein [Hirschia baltica]|uniref:Uncharacterized protein n=1 Tax=Hirschia baltica (strain ATCC 49814 / DSM 5838 / IFAM 1418) TaxID=582402 RepID=C6XR88_HIRBI|nr:hypothetical protein [Hirschia baltica]ACT58720.1 hypothetical protein Hbal_1026 [Hirschia baltica ATCC 49814]